LTREPLVGSARPFNKNPGPASLNPGSSAASTKLARRPWTYTNGGLLERDLRRGPGRKDKHISAVGSKELLEERACRVALRGASFETVRPNFLKSRVSDFIKIPSRGGIFEKRESELLATGGSS
jgi:hypothetical protein